MKFLFYFIVFFSFSCHVLATSSLDNTLFAEFINGLDTRKASFKQTKSIPELDLSFVSEGSIFFQKGKGVVFKQIKPEPLIFTTTT